MGLIITFHMKKKEKGNACMKIVSINSVPYGSTGGIMVEVSKIAEEICNAENFSFYGNWKKHPKKIALNSNRFGFLLENIISALFSKYSGYHNIGSVLGTYFLLKKISSIKPDIIHIHNIHLWVINVPLLFSYIKKYNISVIWTLHDCWAFTGQCPHFTMVKCDKWKTGCYHCPQYRKYPAAYVDRTKTMWELKRKWFTGVENMAIITPSQWLADLVKQSYLKDYQVKVINNGIDLSVFKLTPSDFREKHGLNGKNIVLGVAFGWGKRKGLDVFVELSKRLDSDKYKIVLVGTDDKTDQQLPDNILSIHRTQNQTELAQIYTAADVFANPTREENYPTVNMEAIACGTPVLTFRTGGSPEIIDENTGSVVDCDDIDAMEREIIRICEEKPYSKEACLERAQEFDMNNKFREYIRLYENMVSDKDEQ
jgi:putative colanic acid biosynthesis glycosyltransferase